MVIWKRPAALAISAVIGLVGARTLDACDMVCVTPESYELMLKSYKPTTFVIRPLRVWKGGRQQITLVNASGMCGTTLRAGGLYPVFDLWEERGKVAVTRLDRARRFPPLSVPSADLKP